jgi:acetoin utilization protein AcuB
MADPTAVGTIMTRHVMTVSMDDTLRHVREIFDSVQFHHLVVVEEGRVVGLISDRDLLKNLSPFVGKFTERTQDLSTLNRRVHQIMTRRLVSCREETTLAAAVHLMMDHGVTCLPVLDASGKCVGTVAMRDIMAWSLVRCAGDEDTCRIPRAA